MARQAENAPVIEKQAHNQARTETGHGKKDIGCDYGPATQDRSVRKKRDWKSPIISPVLESGTLPYTAREIVLDRAIKPHFSPQHLSPDRALNPETRPKSPPDSE